MTYDEMGKDVMKIELFVRRKSHKDGVQFQFLYISRFRKRIREDYNQSNKVTVIKTFDI